MIGRKVAFLRGVNVGRAKRLAMADFRSLIEALGYTNVRTLLNSGNAVFDAPGVSDLEAARRIERALLERLDVRSRTTVLAAEAVARIVEGNPLGEQALENPSRLLVAMLGSASEPEKLAVLAERDWSPDKLALAPSVAYLWLPQGILASPLSEAVARVLGEAVTMRNWGTISKLHALATG